MKLILKEDVRNLGFKNEIVDVKPGYGRNFLIPKGMGVLATPSALKMHEESLRQQAAKLEAFKAEAQKRADKLEGAKVELSAKTSSTGSLYGSITIAMVADELEAQGYEINRKMIEMPGIKEIGEYVAKIRLHKDVAVEVPVIVTSENPEDLELPREEEKPAETEEETPATPEEQDEQEGEEVAAEANTDEAAE